MMGIEIFVKIVLEVTDDGRKRAKCTRTSEPDASFEFSGVVSLVVNQWADERFNGWRPAINHRPGLTARLYWQPATFGPNTREHIQHFIVHRYFESLMNSDPALREKISSKLTGTGWYFGNTKLK